MKPTPDEAAQMLENAGVLRGHVKESAARESRAFFGWGAFALVMLPPFDVLERAVWGPIVMIAAFAGWLATNRYYRRRGGRVRLPGFRRWGLVWFAWGIWYGGLVAMAELSPGVGFIWTAAAIGAALPLLGFAVHLSHQGR
jgi:hypothetical protein